MHLPVVDGASRRFATAAGQDGIGYSTEVNITIQQYDLLSTLYLVICEHLGQTVISKFAVSQNDTIITLGTCSFIEVGIL